MPYSQAQIDAGADAIGDESVFYPTSAISPAGQRAWYVRRQNDGQGDNFEPVAGPFGTEKEASAECRRLLVRSVLEAVNDAGEPVIPPPPITNTEFASVRGLRLAADLIENLAPETCGANYGLASNNERAEMRDRENVCYEHAAFLRNAADRREKAYIESLDPADPFKDIDHRLLILQARFRADIEAENTPSLAWMLRALAAVIERSLNTGELHLALDFSDARLDDIARAVYAVFPNGTELRRHGTGVDQYGQPTIISEFQADPWEDAPDRHDQCRDIARAILLKIGLLPENNRAP